MSTAAETPNPDSTVIHRPAITPGRERLIAELPNCINAEGDEESTKKCKEFIHCLEQYADDIADWIRHDLRAHFLQHWKDKKQLPKRKTYVESLLKAHRHEVTRVWCDVCLEIETDCDHRNRYEIIRPVGQGGFGEVFRAEDTTIDRIVAIKYNHDPGTANLDEVQNAASLTGQDFVAIHDVKITKTNRLAIVMEWIDAPTLDAVLKKQSGPWSLRRVCKIMISLLDALKKVHEKGIVHNDLKPANLFLNDDNTVRISDFGGATKIGAIGGQHTPVYSAPEVLKTKPNTIKTDIYSAACIAFEMLTGQRCFTGNVHDGTYDWPKELKSKLQGTIVTAVDKALMKDANQRPESADEFKKAFAGYFTDLPKEPTADDHCLGAAPSHVCHGRDDFIRDEVDAIQRNLGSPNRARLYHGPGGIGKSTVAQEIARHKEIAAQFGRERYYAKLDGVTGAVADAFRLDGADRLQRLDSLLRASVNRLLLLDTVDDPITEAQANVVPLLQKWGGYPRITLLLTSRPGRVPHGDWVTERPIEPMSHSGLAAIFHEQNGEQFSSDSQLDDVLALADGMPLAAKLFGAFANDCESLQEVLDAWAKQGPKILDQNEHDRSLSIRVTVAMSLNRKRIRESEPAQRLLRLLAELPDGWLASELPDILPDDSDEAQRVLRSVGGLAEEIDGRWTMLAPIREELRTKLEHNTDDWHRTICIAANWLAENGMKYGQGIIEPLARFRADQRNFSQLLDAGLAAEIYETVGGSYGFSLFGAFLGIDSEALLRRAVQLGQTKDKPHETALCWDQIAAILKQRGETDEALRIHREEIIPVCERLGNVKGMAVTMGNIADILDQRGETDEALRIRREEQLPVYERLGDLREIAVTMGHIADILDQRGETDEALRIYREDELPVYERLGDARSKEVTLGRIAEIFMLRGEIDEALRNLKAITLIFHDLGDARSKAVTMGKIADILQQRGEIDEALRIRREEELPVYERLGDERSKAVTMGRIADVLVQRGQTDEALRIRREEQLPVYERLGDVRSKAVTMGHIADILQQRGEIDEALRILRDECISAFEHLGDVRSLVMSRANLGITLMIKSARTKAEFEEAREHLRWALATAEKHQYAEAAQLREFVTRWFGSSV